MAVNPDASQPIYLWLPIEFKASEAYHSHSDPSFEPINPSFGGYGGYAPQVL